MLGHAGLAADSGHKVDAVKPELAASGGAVVDGTMMTLTFDEPLDRSSTPALGDFTVSGGDQARTVSRVSVNGSTVLLTLSAGAEHLEAGIQVSYTPGDNPNPGCAGKRCGSAQPRAGDQRHPGHGLTDGEQSGHQLEPGIQPDLCGGGGDRGRGEVQRNGGGDGDAAVEAESGDQEPNGRL